ncbi:MAG: ClpXP protease specificity-enhancing factor SspB [Rhodospirillales bacterium]
MTKDPIDYDLWIEDALRTVAQRALNLAEAQGLPGDHHFYISFRTGAPGAEVPLSLKAQYPEEMTIVIQHQFENLEVGEDAFLVTLRFNGKPERLRVPFAAITSFNDPSVKFGLQYAKTAARPENRTAAPPADTAPEPAAEKDEGEKKTGEVIALDRFRKK